MYSISSEFNSIIPKEIQLRVFECLPLHDLIQTVGLVCTEWRAAAEYVEGFKAPSFKEIVLGDPESSAYINEQWRGFEAHVLSSDLPQLKKNRLLLKARKVFEAGVAELYKKYRKWRMSDGDKFIHYMACNQLGLSLGDYTLFDKLLGCRSVSEKLNNDKGHELKELFLTFADDRNLLIKAVIYDYATSIGNTDFINFLIKKKPEWLNDERLAVYLCARCRINQNQGLLKFYLEKLVLYQGIDSEEEEAFFTVFKTINFKSVGVALLYGINDSFLLQQLTFVAHYPEQMEHGLRSYLHKVRAQA